MQEIKFRVLSAITAVVVIIMIVVPLLNGNYILPVLSVIIGILALILIRKQFKDIIIEDERNALLSLRSTKFSFVLFNIIGAIAGNTLIILGKNGPLSFAIIGYTLSFSVCFMLLVDVIVYFCLNRIQAS
jgi:uncharacterized membrane protein